MLSFKPLLNVRTPVRGNKSSYLASTSNSMAEWSHTHKHQGSQDRTEVLEYLHDSEALLGNSKDVTAIRQVPIEAEDGDADDCWLVVEKVKGLSLLEATTRVRIKRTPDGVNIHRKTSYGVEVWSIWTVPGPSSSPKERNHRTIATEFVMAKAPWYIMPIVKSRISQSFSDEPLQERLEF